MSDSDRLTGYVEVWWQAIDDFTTLLEQLPAEDWSTPTDLPGWDVRAVAAHTAHLESLLAGGQHDEVEIGSPDHVRGPMGTFTEQGVVARRDRSPDELINEIRSSATTRHTALRAEPPAEPTTRLALSRSTFIERAGCRRTAETDAVRIEGDADLGQRLVAGLAVTP